MEIEPKYVTFEQAVWFKERGFDEECKYYYDLEYKKLTFHVEDLWKNSEIENGYPAGTFPKCRKYPTPMISAPEQWMVAEWLRLNHGIWITPIPRLNSWIFSIVEVKTSNHYSLIDIDFYGDNDYLTSKGIPTIMMSPQEAYSAAFDYIKDNRIF